MNTNNQTLVECGASAQSVEELRKEVKKSYGGVGKVLWEIRRAGTAKRKECFDALRAEGVKFGGRISSALWKLADDLQTSTEWTAGMTDKAEATARAAAMAESKKGREKKNAYEKALDAIADMRVLISEEERTDQVLDALTLISIAITQSKAEREAMLEALAKTAKAAKAPAPAPAPAPAVAA